jgi:hypothetical protein
MPDVSAYKNALAIEPDDSDRRMELAAEMLADGEGTVMLGGVLALRSTGHELVCEVVDRNPSARRCENEYEVMVENARLALERSRLHDLLPPVPQKWLVVEDAGTGTTELWRAPG